MCAMESPICFTGVTWTGGETGLPVELQTEKYLNKPYTVLREAGSTTSYFTSWRWLSSSPQQLEQAVPRTLHPEMQNIFLNNF